MDPYLILFQLAALRDPSFLGDDDTSTILTMEANRLRWPRVPSPCGDKAAFATGYIMGREKMGRDPHLPVGKSVDYDLGYERGVEVWRGAPKPEWDRDVVAN